MERVPAGPAVADTFCGRIHVEWDNSATVTPLGQLPFFIEYLKQGGLFDSLVADCPLHYTSPNAPTKRDVLGTVLLSVLERWYRILRPGAEKNSWAGETSSRRGNCRPRPPCGL